MGRAEGGWVINAEIEPEKVMMNILSTKAMRDMNPVDNPSVLGISFHRISSFDVLVIAACVRGTFCIARWNHTLFTTAV